MKVGDLQQWRDSGDSEAQRDRVRRWRMTIWRSWLRFDSISIVTNGSATVMASGGSRSTTIGWHVTVMASPRRVLFFFWIEDKIGIIDFVWGQNHHSKEWRYDFQPPSQNRTPIINSKFVSCPRNSFLFPTSI